MVCWGGGGLRCCTVCAFCFKIGAEGIGVIYHGLGWGRGMGRRGENRDDVEFV